MPVTFGTLDYEAILNDQYYLKDVLEGITLTDSLDNIAYKAEVKIVVTPDFPGVMNGQPFRVSGIPLGGTSMVHLLSPAVVWEADSKTTGQKHMTLTCYDRTIYLDKSEDEYLFPAGQTANQRITQYASDWGFDIDPDNFPDTGILLADTGTGRTHRGTIYSVMLADLQETAMMGGDMFRPRITDNGLGLFKLGTNSPVWVLENAESIEQLRTLEGATTQVKVRGKTSTSAGEALDEPLLAVVKGQTAQFGTLQQLVYDTRVTNTAQANALAQDLLTGVLETFTVVCPDINTVRSGDTIVFNNMSLIVTDVSHQLGSPGHMTVQVATSDYVRRKYYTNVRGPI